MEPPARMEPTGGAKLHLDHALESFFHGLYYSPHRNKAQCFRQKVPVCADYLGKNGKKEPKLSNPVLS